MVQNGFWQWLLDGFRFDLETPVKPKTVGYYCDHIRVFVRWAEDGGGLADPRSITRREIQGFFHELAERERSLRGREHVGRSERHRWPYYRALKRFFAWGLSEGHLEHDPLDGLELKAPKGPPVEPYHPEHIERFFKVLDHDWQVAETPRQRMLAARDRAILCLFLESGLRLSELAGLSLADIDLERQRALVREGKMGKGRLVGFGLQTKKALWRYLGLRAAQVAGDALWVTEEGGPFGRGSIQVMIRRLKKDAGLHNVKGSAYKLALHTSLAEDLAARDAEEAIKKGHPLSPEEVELRKGYYLSGIPARLTRMRYHSLEWCTQSNLPPQIRASPGNHPPPGRGLRQGGARLSQG